SLIPNQRSMCPWLSCRWVSALMARQSSLAPKLMATAFRKQSSLMSQRHRHQRGSCSHLRTLPVGCRALVSQCPVRQRGGRTHVERVLLQGSPHSFHYLNEPCASSSS